MNYYTFNVAELADFLEHNIYAKNIENEELVPIIESCTYWELNCYGLNYFLGRIIQKKIREDRLDENYLEETYKLSDKIFFNIGELGSDFISYLLLHDRLLEIDNNLEEMLSLMHTEFLNREYGRIVRY